MNREVNDDHNQSTDQSKICSKETGEISPTRLNWAGTGGREGYTKGKVQHTHVCLSSPTAWPEGRQCAAAALLWRWHWPSSWSS